MSQQTPAEAETVLPAATVVTPPVVASTPAEVAKPKFESLEQAAARVEALEAEAEKNKELLTKVRKFEKENKEAAEKALLEQGKYKELYEANQTRLVELETASRNANIDASLTALINEAKPKSASTVAKLIDRNKIVVKDGVVDTAVLKAMVLELQKSDPFLFEDGSTPAVKTPGVKRPSEGAVVAGFEVEIRAAKNSKDIQAVMKKYNKI